MSKWNLEKMVFVSICQKCDSLPVLARLANLEILPGVIYIPDILYCAVCGAQLTVQTRPAREDELKKLAEKDVRKLDEISDEAIAVAGLALAETVRDIDAVDIDRDKDVTCYDEIKKES